MALKSCDSSLEQLVTRTQATNDDIASNENTTGAEQEENRNLLDNKKVLQQKQTALNQWLSKVQGASEKVLASMLWKDTDEA